MDFKSAVVDQSLTVPPTRVLTNLTQASDHDKEAEAPPAVAPIEDDDPYLVDWDGEDDQENARNMSKLRKWVIVLLMFATTFQLTMLNSVWSTVTGSIQEAMDCSEIVALLGLSMFVLALAIGPLVVAPMSEYYGRRLLYAIAFPGYVVFQLPTAFGQNIATLVVGRFITGLFGSVLLSNTPGTVSDILYKDELYLPMNLMGFASIGGPGIGPLLGAYIGNALGYKWVFIIFAIMSAAMGVLVLLIVPETYEPMLKAKKAKRLRKTTNNSSYYATHEKGETSFGRVLVNNCKRPLMLLWYEPMMQVLCFYTGFFMAIIYLFLTAFPMVFEDVYGFDNESVGLTFIGNAAGMGLAVVTSPLFERLRQRQIRNNNGVSTPELRIPQACAGGIVVPIGLFIFAWTVYPSVHWMVPIFASFVFGIGCNWTISTVLAYLVESYPLFAASAVAANVFVRCLISTAFPLFSRQMMRGLGYHWAMSLVGFLAVAMAPCGFIFYRYGPLLREKSRYAQ